MLIVDDSDEDRYLLKRYLQRSDLPLVIVEANNAHSALDILTSPLAHLEEKHPQLQPPVTLFLDINMPLMTGWEFVEELQKREQDISLNPTVIIMYSTAESEYEDHKIEDFDNIAGYIVKGSASPEQLRQAIINAVARSL